MPFSKKTLNAFEMTCRAAACEIPAKRNGNRAFVGIYPPWPAKRIVKWRIKRFEIPAALVSESVYDGDLVDLQFIGVDTLGEVEDVLLSWGIASSLFDAPWKCDWPL
jgi:hypothetical protein